MSFDEYYKSNTHGYMNLGDDLFSAYVFEQIESSIPRLKPYTSKAIEIGSGMGRFSPDLVKRFRYTDLVEPSQDFYRQLRVKFSGHDEGVSFFNKTAGQYIEEFDADESVTVFTFHLLHHISRADRIELFRFVVKQGIKAVFVEPNPYNPMILLQVFLHPDMSFEEEKPYLKLTRKGLGEELGQAGMRHFEHKRICFFPPFVSHFLIRIKLRPVLRFFDRFCQILPFMPSYQLFFYDPDTG